MRSFTTRLPGLICLENNHGNSGGRCLSVDYTDKVGEVAKKHGLKLHIDGSRIFNASVLVFAGKDRLSTLATEAAQKALQMAEVEADDVDLILLCTSTPEDLFGSAPQANQRIIDAVGTRLEIPPERIISNLANYGNTSAASIPLALDEAVRSGKVQPGHKIEFNRPENWVAPYPKYEQGWWESFLLPGSSTSEA